MASQNSEYRLVKVGNELGYFHCWEQYTTLLDNQFFDKPAQVSKVCAIVEFADGTVRLINHANLKFVDEINHFLYSMNNHND